MNLESVMSALQSEAQRIYPNEPLGPIILHNYKEFLQEQDQEMRAGYLVSMELCSQLAQTTLGRKNMEETYLEATKMFINSFLPKELYELRELFDESIEEGRSAH